MTTTRTRAGALALAAVLPLAALAATSTQTASGAPASTFFERTATYPVYLNRPANEAATASSVAEISAVTADGSTLVYTDGPSKRVGFLDITDPGAPVGAGTFDLAKPGDAKTEPTSVAEIYELAKMGPSAANLQPLRALWVRTTEGKERLAAHMSEGNRAKTLSAPAVAVLAWDSRFHEHVPTVFPIRPEMQQSLEDDPGMREGMGRFSATLQIGTFVMAVRATGLAAGPRAGFDTAGVDADLFADGRWQSLLVVNVGHPGDNPWFDRLPRLDAQDAVAWA